MPTITDYLYELHMHAAALHLRADSHIESSPGDSYVERLMADNVQSLAEKIESALAQLREHPPETKKAGS
ncbi:MAG: hypothetical protein ACNI27_12985 [Desulfovibrio sp.]